MNRNKDAASTQIEFELHIERIARVYADVDLRQSANTLRRFVATMSASDWDFSAAEKELAPLPAHLYE